MTPPDPVKPIDPAIVEFLRAHHVLTLCTAENGVPYAANCYYVFLEPGTAGAADELRTITTPCFVFLSDRTTRHGRELTINPLVAGTVHVEPPPDESGVGQIRGVQFTGRARLLAPESNAVNSASPIDTIARDAYFTAFPYARGRPTDCWLLAVDFIKMTDNTVRFGFKRTWPATGNVAP